MATDLLVQIVGDLAREPSHLGDSIAADPGCRPATRGRRGPGGTAARPAARAGRPRARCASRTRSAGPARAHTRVSSSCSTSRVIASSAANGSSMSSTRAVLGERPGQRDPLAHAAGQLVHPLAAVRRRGCTTSSSALGLARGARPGRRRAACSASSTFARGGEPGQQRRLLEHQRRPVRRHRDRARRRRRQPGDQVQQRRLPAARTPRAGRRTRPGATVRSTPCEHGRAPALEDLRHRPARGRGRRSTARPGPPGAGRRVHRRDLRS